MVILIVDDETGVRSSLQQLLGDTHEVIACEGGLQALRALEKTSVDLVLTDHQMPGLTGLELIRKGKELSPSTAFILMTAFGTVEQAVEAIRLGAEDYLMKPFDLSEIELRVRKAEELRLWKAETALKQGAETGADRLIGASPAIRAAREFIHKVADAPSPVLLLGPSGSGKEVVAKAIHESGARAPRPFIAINCASLSEQLMESELFGHEKGSFTGATAAKPGKFELAKGGTIFLDEVGELSPSLQAKLLRVLQEKEFFRIGGVRQIKSDARVIAATHRPLREMVAKGGFREDLFFRLNVLSLELAPLSARAEDIPLLVEHLWSKLGRELGSRARLSPEALEALRRYPYPGNVRELQNVLERLIVLHSGESTIQASALPPEFRSAPLREAQGSASEEPHPPRARSGSLALNEQLETLEREIVSQAMSQAQGNQVRASELLGITRGALQYKLRKYGLKEAA